MPPSCYERYKERRHTYALSRPVGDSEVVERGDDDCEWITAHAVYRNEEGQYRRQASLYGPDHLMRAAGASKNDNESAPSLPEGRRVDSAE